jgi:hypothetical protein
MSFNAQAWEDQTWDFSSAALSNSIYIPSGYEVVGYKQSAAMAANTDKFRLHVVMPTALAAADAGAGTFVAAVNSAGTIELPASAAAANPVLLKEDEIIRGPLRVKLQGYDSGTGAVAQTTQVVYPMIRRVR